MAKLLVVAPMIVRNEAENLPALFESARGLVDAWVIVDTGSTDNTIEVARSLGATVIEDPWDDDFARSRNVVLSHAEEVHPDADWFIILDGDDRVENATGLRSEPPPRAASNPSSRHARGTPLRGLAIETPSMLPQTWTSSEAKTGTSTSPSWSQVACATWATPP